MILYDSQGGHKARLVLLLQEQYQFWHANRGGWKVRGVFFALVGYTQARTKTKKWHSDADTRWFRI